MKNKIMIDKAVKDDKIIEVEKLNFAYEEGRKVLENISFTIQKGSFIGVVGESGCGKSTLCQILAGIIPNVIGGFISGRVIIGGYDLKESELKDVANVVGFVMQNPNRQIVTSTVEDELAFGPENFCVPADEIRERVDKVLNLLELNQVREVNPNRLSGGQQEVVAIGSVLTMNPDIIIMDEPFSNLDEYYRDKLRRIIYRLKQEGKTVIVVEHDNEMLEGVDTKLVFNQGRVVEA